MHCIHRSYVKVKIFPCTISFLFTAVELIEYEKGDLKVCIEQGENWLHEFPLFLGIKKNNPPQIAIWLEDAQGNYLSTIYASYKIATQSWQAAGGKRRKEALPHWCHSRGIKYADGLYLPTKKEPLNEKDDSANLIELCPSIRAGTANRAIALRNLHRDRSSLQASGYHRQSEASLTQGKCFLLTLLCFIIG